MLTVLDLFSGIGGFSLGLERTGGFKTVAFCEIDPFCRKVLAKHWPGVPIYEDITTANFTEGCADVVCGGFPCQDISTAGKRAGITGERSGLWQYMVGAVRMVRPRLVIVENVAALLSNGLGTVVGDLAEIGYDAEWHCIPASAVGAPHRRDRWWAVAYPGGREGGKRHVPEMQWGWEVKAEQIGLGGSDVDYPARVQQGRQEQRPQRKRTRACSESFRLADAVGPRLSDNRGGGSISWGARFGTSRDAGGDSGGCNHWLIEPDVGRVAHGVPSRVDRLRSLGNAVVPQIPELIGRAILAAYT